jgi:hypothetical protein
MTKKELKELIKSTIKEYMGTGSSDVKSQRVGGGSFKSDEDEIKFYNNQNAGDGGQGMQTRGMEKTQKIGNPNRTRFTRI